MAEAANRGKLILITGGARSGKSAFAERYARNSGKKVIYVATARVLDSEMTERVREHRARRPPDWQTVEAHRELIPVIRRFDQAGHLLLVDCLTLLTANLLLEAGDSGEDGGEIAGMDPDLRSRLVEQILRTLDSAARAARDARADVIAVTNEVGMGIVPDNLLGRIYRDLAGNVNQAWAALADEVYVMFAGLPLKVR